MSNPTLDFTQFALDRKLIKESCAVRIRRRGATEQKPLGQILIFNGDLSVAQVMSVLEKQIETPSTRFGQLAIEAGYITTVDLERALRQQKHEYKHHIDLIRQEGLISDTTMCDLVVQYVRLLEMGIGE